MTPFRNVYILGAGFSNPAGAPVMRGFIDAVRKCRSDQRLDADERSWFDDVLQFRRDLSGKHENYRVDLDNIEQLFGYAELQTMLSGTISTRARNLVFTILRTLELSIRGIEEEYLPASLQPLEDGTAKWLQERWGLTSNARWEYHALGVMLGQSLDRTEGPDAVVSFNYDTLLKRSLLEVGYRCDYGLDTPMLGEDGFLWRSPNRIPVLKLHGSANWFTCKDCKKLFIAPPRMLKHDPRVSLLLMFAKSACPSCSAVGLHTPAIVPPTWNKSAYRLGIDRVWKKAVDAIESAQRIVVIGYSFPESDTFFRYLLSWATRVGEGVRLCLLDPDPRAKERYDAFLSDDFKTRYLYDASGFSTYGIGGLTKFTGLTYENRRR